MTEIKNQRTGVPRSLKSLVSIFCFSRLGNDSNVSINLSMLRVSGLGSSAGGLTSGSGWTTGCGAVVAALTLILGFSGLGPQGPCRGPDDGTDVLGLGSHGPSNSSLALILAKPPGKLSRVLPAYAVDQPAF